jgi:hypothetical protein
MAASRLMNHAPTFIDDEKYSGGGGYAAYSTDGSDSDSGDPVADSSCLYSSSRVPHGELLRGLDCRGMAELFNEAEKGAAVRNKANRRAKRTRIGKLADDVAWQLDSSGWAVMDGFISSASVAAVREEMNLLEPHYEASEIWVGKANGGAVGAQISVPKVRGDKVLWMCGGHQMVKPHGQEQEQDAHGGSSSSGGGAGPGGGRKQAMWDSAGEQPQQRGTIAPCSRAIKVRLEGEDIRKQQRKAKAAAKVAGSSSSSKGPMGDGGGGRRVAAADEHKYGALKDLIRNIDRLVLQVRFLAVHYSAIRTSFRLAPPPPHCHTS